ncbi:MAG: prephenate dehydratase [Chloroflexi bacterium]|nr:prephenate dehydratase [Chloroflexota bacterium]
MAKKVAYLGPAGTYAEQAAVSYDPDAEGVPCPSIPAVAQAVERGDADEGVVPIENSLQGSVTFTLDLLIHDSNLFIRNELVLPIHHSLLAAPGTRAKDITVIYSHPQALAQCQDYIAKHHPKAEVVASLSTATAVQELAKHGKNAAAIGNLRAAELYGAEVLASNIEDNPNNVTRFVVLGKTPSARTGSDKTSICFWFDDDAPGLLYKVIKSFHELEINLAKIESRPTRESLGRYIFLIDMDGHRDDARVKKALAEVEKQVSILKVFGSYPKAIAPV